MADWALSHPMPTGAAQAVQLVIAMRADNEDGTCWPSIATIARQAAVSSRLVHRVIKALQAMGRLVEVGYHRLRTKIWRFVMTEEPAPERPIGRPDPRAVDQPDLPELGLPPRHPCTGVAPCMTPRHTIPQKIPQKERTETTSPQPAATPPPAPGPLSVDELLWKDGLAVLLALMPARTPEAARGIIGKLVKLCGGYKFAAYSLLRDAMRCNPESPEDWLFAAARNRQRRQQIPVPGEPRPFDPSKLTGAALGLWKIQQKKEARRRAGHMDAADADTILPTLLEQAI